ncbi:MAG: hypothetical protein Ct9H90mP5_06130 [Acidimicrobiaceae bacterium]|nr:MAG: hypothetical protein Ct9H90mP5_06130 [Acidimicrobiaceae bacterium]
MLNALGLKNAEQHRSSSINFCKFGAGFGEEFDLEKIDTTKLFIGRC